MSDFIYKHFTNTDMGSLVQLLNDNNCSTQDVQSVLSNNNFHVFYKRGTKTGGQWKHEHIFWSDLNKEQFAADLTDENRIVLGINGNDFHHLYWTAS